MSPFRRDDYDNTARRGLRRPPPPPSFFFGGGGGGGVRGGDRYDDGTPKGAKIRDRNNNTHSIVLQ